MLLWLKQHWNKSIYTNYFHIAWHVPRQYLHLIPLHCRAYEEFAYFFNLNCHKLTSMTWNNYFTSRRFCLWSHNQHIISFGYLQSSFHTSLLFLHSLLFTLDPARGERAILDLLFIHCWGKSAGSCYLCWTIQVHLRSTEKGSAGTLMHDLYASHLAWANKRLKMLENCPGEHDSPL